MSDLDRLHGNFSIPIPIRFGAGRIAELPEVCKSLGIARPLIVTDPGVAALPMVTDAIKANEAAGLPTGLFSDLKPNPVGQNVMNGVAVFKDGNHDGMIAWGGGSGLDVGKSIAYIAPQTVPWVELAGLGDEWMAATTEGIVPIIAVPTTSGTGSEVGRAAAVIDENTSLKRVLFHPKLMPAVTLADPALTVGLPPRLTAGTGMDALAHNIEAYCVPDYHPFCEGIAVEAIRLIAEWLAVAVKDGSNMEARSHMMVASMAGATAFQKGLGAIHSLSHPVGSRFDSHHGETNGVVMPYVLAYNAPAIEAKMTRLARYLDLPNPSTQAVVDWTLRLREDISTPHTLAEYGVTDADVAQLTADAVIDPAGFGNPRPLSSEMLAGLFKASIHGEIPIP